MKVNVVFTFLHRVLTCFRQLELGFIHFREKSARFRVLFDLLFFLTNLPLPLKHKCILLMNYKTSVTIYIYFDGTLTFLVNKNFQPKET